MAAFAQAERRSGRAGRSTGASRWVHSRRGAAGGRARQAGTRDSAGRPCSFLLGRSCGAHTSLQPLDSTGWAVCCQVHTRWSGPCGLRLRASPRVLTCSHVKAGALTEPTLLHLLGLPSFPCPQVFGFSWVGCHSRSSAPSGSRAIVLETGFLPGVQNATQDVLSW